MNTVTNSQYIHRGMILFIISSLLLIVIQTYFQEQIQYSGDYKKDVCVITNFHFKKALYNCWTDNGNVNEVVLPCVQVYVNSSKNKHLSLYRNIQEKITVKTNNLNECTYMPTACENHPNYLKHRLSESLLEMFPPIDFPLEFNLEKNFILKFSF